MFLCLSAILTLLSHLQLSQVLAQFNLQSRTKCILPYLPFVVKLHLLHQTSQLCLTLKSQPQLEFSTRTNLRLGNAPVEVRLGSCGLRQSNKNNQNVDISMKKQKDQAGVREENKQRGILKNIC